MLQIYPRGPVLFVTLDRPEVRNAINDELIAALTNVFESIEPNVRAAVLSGNGKAFCAGGDLDWMRRAAAYTEQENFQDAVKLGRLFAAIAHCRVPVIAKVHGAAFGGGSGLVAAADIALASPETKFAFSEVRLGLLPGTISPYVIPKIGPGNAKALFLTGEAFDSATALRIGLIHKVTEDLDAAVQEKLAAILGSGSNAVAASKKLVNDYPLAPDECARRLASLRASEEGKEGVAAFLEKRKPAFFTEPS